MAVPIGLTKEAYRRSVANSRGLQPSCWLPQSSPGFLHDPILPGLEMDQAVIIPMWTSVWPCSELNTATEEKHGCIGKTEPLYSSWQQGTLDFEFALPSGKWLPWFQ